MSTRVWIAVVVLAGCESKQQAAPDPKPVARAVDAATIEVPEPPPTPGPTIAAPGAPPACREYAAIADRLSTCDKLPESTRLLMRDSVQQAVAVWNNLPSYASKDMESACAAAASALRDALVQLGCKELFEVRGAELPAAN